MAAHTDKSAGVSTSDGNVKVITASSNTKWDDEESHDFVSAIYDCNTKALEVFYANNQSVHNGGSGHDTYFPLYLATEAKEQKDRDMLIEFMIRLVQKNVKECGEKYMFCVESELPTAYRNLLEKKDYNNIRKLYNACGGFFDSTEMFQIKKDDLDLFNTIITNYRKNGLEKSHVDEILKDIDEFEHPDRCTYCDGVGGIEDEPCDNCDGSGIEGGVDPTEN